MSKCGLAESGRTGKQYMVKRLTTISRRLYEDLEVLNDLALARELVESRWTQSGIYIIDFAFIACVIVVSICHRPD